MSGECKACGQRLPTGAAGSSASSSRSATLGIAPAPPDGDPTVIILRDGAFYEWPWSRPTYIHYDWANAYNPAFPAGTVTQIGLITPPRGACAAVLSVRFRHLAGLGGLGAAFTEIGGLATYPYIHFRETINGKAIYDLFDPYAIGGGLADTSYRCALGEGAGFGGHPGGGTGETPVFVPEGSALLFQFVQVPVGGVMYNPGAGVGMQAFMTQIRGLWLTMSDYNKFIERYKSW